MKTKVVLISGKKQHGKNTAAKFIAEFGAALGYNVIEMAFADPLKEAAMLLFRLKPEQVYGTYEKEEMDPRWGMTPREILQKLGTEVGRNIHPEVWVRNLCFRIQEAKFDVNCPAPTIVLVTDCRFPNEIAIPKEILKNVSTLRIERPRMPATAFDNHPSETGLDNFKEWDTVIVNSGKLAEFHEQVLRMMPDFIKETV